MLSLVLAVVHVLHAEDAVYAEDAARLAAGVVLVLVWCVGVGVVCICRCGNFFVVFVRGLKSQAAAASQRRSPATSASNYLYSLL